MNDGMVVDGFGKAERFHVPDGWEPPKEGDGKRRPAAADDDDAADGDDPLPGGVVELRASDPLDLQLSRLPRNDWGNAQRLVRRYGEGLMYVVNSGWYGWDGARWSGQRGNFHAKERAHQAALDIYKEAEALRAHFRFLDGDIADEARRLGLVPSGWRADSDKAVQMILELVAKEAAALVKWSVNSGNAARTVSMMAQAEPTLCRDIADLDARPYLLNFPNGTLELLPGKGGAAPSIRFREHAHADLLTKCMAVAWKDDWLADMLESGAGTLWELTLADILPQLDQRRFLGQWYGYCTGGPPHEQAVLIMAGEGSNGKSVIVETIEAAMGDYAMRLPVESLKSDDSRRGSDARPDLADLPGRRLVVAAEPKGGMKLDTGQLKQLTERTVLRVRQLHQHFISFTPQHRMVIQCNEKPVVQGADRGTWRRLKALDFKEKYVRADEMGMPGNEKAKLRDDTLPDRLALELEVVACWLVAGWLDYAAAGLVEPDSVRADTEQYRSDNDPVGNFIKAALVPAPGKHITGAEMYGAYKRWCEASGFEAWSGTAFGRRLAVSLRKVTSGTVKYLDVTWVPGGFI